MLNALRSATKAQPLAVFSNPSHYINICSKSSQIRFRTLLTEAGKQDEIKMDETKKPGTETKPKDTMSSFGEGYATRSDEEGFGGIYGGNQDVEEKIVHGNAPEYDTKQGSEVKEKEKARNQPQAS
ncbi:uncharacterized protein LOC107788119 [Nicotiana tabacum]|uniref:Uncharacterized protein LOC107788119 n=2 Tax=Nicotiana TaxID=4085 RepID=A0A1S3ZLK8_TOBAC|nr:PREDICTED: uncharacterized protein LOC104211838 [Nicotiana sylvestris]XP_016465261.1 PREDICTED: uncharacterized protein LOC107788119 [Nicotiana tabacum]